MCASKYSNPSDDRTALFLADVAKQMDLQMPFKFMFKKKMNVRMSTGSLDSGGIFEQVKSVRELLERKIKEIYVSYSKNLKIENTTLQLTTEL